MSDSETLKPAGARRARGAQTAGPEAQQHLLRAADELFYREGVRTVGVDAVVERAGVNKMSLYRQFSSKDELVMAYLERKDEQFFGYVEKSFAKHPGEPARQLQQYFDDLAVRASVDDYRGCPFVNVSVEFSDTTHPARQFVFRNKERLMARLLELTTAAGADDPVALGQRTGFDDRRRVRGQPDLRPGLRADSCRTEGSGAVDRRGMQRDAGGLRF